MDFMPSPMQDKENSAHCKVEYECCEHGAEIKLAKVFVADILWNGCIFWHCFWQKNRFQTHGTKTAKLKNYNSSDAFSPQLQANALKRKSSLSDLEVYLSYMLGGSHPNKQICSKSRVFLEKKAH